VALYFSVRIGARGDAARASLPRSTRPQKQRNFLTIIPSVEGSGEEPTKSGKDISLFWHRRFVLQKAPFQSPLYLRDFHYAFFRLRVERGAFPWRTHVVTLLFALTLQHLLAAHSRANAHSCELLLCFRV